MSGSIKRRKKNEVLFKRLNRQFVDIVEELSEENNGSKVEVGNFLCECGEESCTQTITLKIDKYRDITRGRGIYLAVPGHEKKDVEKVIEEYPAYLILKKKGEKKS